MEFRVTAADVRPAGDPSRCFYCNKRLGSNHSPDCVLLVRISKYHVMAPRNRMVGLFFTADPAAWSVRECEDHKNEGSWCLDNMLENGGLVKYSGFPDIETMDDCLCSYLRLELDHRFEDVMKSGISHEKAADYAHRSRKCIDELDVSNISIEW